MYRTLNTALPLLGLLLLPLTAHADLIKQGASYAKTVLVTDSSGNDVTGLTTSSFTATASKSGAAATSITTPTVTEIGSGKYSILIPASLTNTIGALDITLTATGTVQTDSHDQVVGFDPASDLGAAALTSLGTGQTTIINQTTSAQRQADLAAYGTATGSQVAAVPGNVWTQGTRTITGGTITGGTITGGTITTYTGNTPQTGDPYLLATTGAGVKIATGQSTSASNFVAAPTVAQNQAGLPTDTTIQADMIASLTAQGYTVTRSAKLDNLDTNVGSRLATTGYTAPAAFPSTVSLSIGDETKIASIGADTPGVTLLLGRPAQTGDTFGLVSPLVAAGQFTPSALANAPAGGYTGLTDADTTAVANKLLTTNLFSGLTLGTAWGDMWATDAGPSTATRPSLTQQITVYTTPAGAGQHTTTLTTDTSGRPISRTVTHP